MLERAGNDGPGKSENAGSRDRAKYRESWLPTKSE